MRLAWRRINLTVAGGLLLFGLIYMTVVTCVIIPWLSYSVPGVLNLGILTVDTAVALFCFLACVTLDPGSVPENYFPDEEESAVVMEIKRKSGTARYCKKCGRHKPPRSHHCRVCRRCVLRMDHHCPWINNCVGHANYKAFLLFLLYVNAAVVHAMGLFVAHAVHLLRLHAEKRTHAMRAGPQATTNIRAAMGWAILQTLCMAITLPLAIGLVMLLVWNAYLVHTNKTTIEYHEGVTARIMAANAGRSWNHPYDLGLCANLAEICGTKPQWWLVPNRASAAGSGHKFLTSWEDNMLGLAL